MTREPSAKRVLVVDLTGPDSRDLVHAGRRLGHEVFAVCHAGHAESFVSWTGVRHLPSVDMSDQQTAVAQIADLCRGYQIDAVVTASEFLTPLVARACAAVGLPCNEVADGPSPFRNKVAMAARLVAAGVAVPRTLVVNSEHELAHLIDAEHVAFPLVVKPAENAGSRGVVVVSGPEALASAVAAARGQEDPYDIPLDRRLLVQEFLDGQEFSVESVVHRGVATHVCVTRKITTSGMFRVEIGHSLPADLDTSTRSSILRAW